MTGAQTGQMPASDAIYQPRHAHGANPLNDQGNSQFHGAVPQAFEIARQSERDSHRHGTNNPLMLRAIWDGQAECYAQH